MKYLFYQLPKVALLPQAAAAALILSALIAVGCTSLKAEPEMGDGTVYEGAAMGYRGIIRVRVGLDQGTITEITVVESYEDRNVGEAAIEELTDLVLMYNTTELDAISGATETSRGFLEAIERAIMDP
jgi:fumarate reductase flavoprotein subunit